MQRVCFVVGLLWVGAGGCHVRESAPDESGGDFSGDDFPVGTDDCGIGGCCASVPGSAAEFRCSPIDSWDTGLDGDTGLDDVANDTGPPEHVCTSNVLQDGGFELGTPNPAWDEFATALGTPICNDACSTGAGPMPNSGEWLAWFGGVQRPAQASLTQTFSVTAQTAQLRFSFMISDAAGTGDDRFAVVVDGNTVFFRTDADIENFANYTIVALTLDQWADGEPHELRLESEVFGERITSFVVDDVELIGCGTVGPSGSSSDGATDDTSGGSDASGSSGSSGGSGGSTGSGGSGGTDEGTGGTTG